MKKYSSEMIKKGWFFYHKSSNSRKNIIQKAIGMQNSSTGSHTASSEFFFNFNPTSLQLPDGALAIILRTVANQTNPATRENPDFLTLSRVRKMGDSEGRGAIVIDIIVAEKERAKTIFRSYLLRWRRN